MVNQLQLTDCFYFWSIFVSHNCSSMSWRSKSDSGAGCVKHLCVLDRTDRFCFGQQIPRFWQRLPGWRNGSHLHVHWTSVWGAVECLQFPCDRYCEWSVRFTLVHFIHLTCTKYYSWVTCKFPDQCLQELKFPLTNQFSGDHLDWIWFGLANLILIPTSQLVRWIWPHEWVPLAIQHPQRQMGLLYTATLVCINRDNIQVMQFVRFIFNNGCTCHGWNHCVTIVTVAMGSTTVCCYNRQCFSKLPPSKHMTVLSP